MPLFPRNITGVLAVLMLVTLPSWAQSDSVKPSIEDLDQKVRILERKLEVTDEIAAAKTPPPVVSADGDGFVIKSADGNFVLKTRGLLQADYRAFINDTNYNDSKKPGDSLYTDNGGYFQRSPKLVNTFLLRKARPIWDATLFKYYNFRLVSDFSGGALSLVDAYAEVNFWPQLKFRLGKFMPIVSLERMQATSDNNFMELNLPASLAANRDIGAQISGDFLNESVNYAVGIFNGAPDGVNSDVENTNDKDYSGRIFVLPFKNTGVEILHDFGLGIAGTWGKIWGDSANNNIANFKSSGQNTYFSYLQNKNASGISLDSGTVRADGEHYRINPQGYWYAGPFSVLGEYIISSQKVARGKPIRDTTVANKTFIEGDPATLKNQAWGVSITYVVTGEPASFKSVKPRHNLSPDGSGIGALELVARVGQLTPDEKTFTKKLYADTLASARKATSFGGGVNWYLSRQVKWVLDYEFTQFDQGAKNWAGIIKDRDNEQLIATRLQLNF